MAKATLAPGKPLACPYYSDAMSSFPGNRRTLSSKLRACLQETQ
jgi:hypothetical protein